MKLLLCSMKNSMKINHDLGQEGQIIKQEVVEQFQEKAKFIEGGELEYPLILT